MKKTITIIILFICLIALSAKCVYDYCADHPNIVISHSYPSNSDNYIELAGIAYNFRMNVSPSAGAEAQMNEFTALQDEVYEDIITNYSAPRHIEVDGKLEDGIIHVYYSGTCTDNDGRTVDYYKEVQMPFDLCGENRIFPTNPTL